jgi:hypothetical protein
MRIGIGVLGLAALALVLGGCIFITKEVKSSGTDSMTESGPMKSEQRKSGDFHAIEIGSAIEAEIHLGPASVKVDAPESVLSQVVTEIEDGTLKVEIRDSVTLGQPVRVTISTPLVDSVEASGASTVSFQDIKADTFHCGASGASKLVLKGSVSSIDLQISGASQVDLSGFDAKSVTAQCDGASHVTLGGQTNEASLSGSGASGIEASGLKTRSCKVEASGASNIEVDVSDKLDVQASGGSTVNYSGSPEVTQDASGGSTVGRI